MTDDHPALLASRRSWAAVEADDRNAWLALMAPDILIEDPIGEAPTNPTGQGVSGLAAVAEFWDTNIGPNTIRFTTHESRVAGSEAAHLLTLETTLDGGLVATVTGIFTYRVNRDGLLTNLRGYWTMDDMTFDGG